MPAKSKPSGIYFPDLQTKQKECEILSRAAARRYKTSKARGTPPRFFYLSAV